MVCQFIGSVPCVGVGVIFLRELFVNTSNGLDETHINLPSPDAPTFICMDKNTGEVYWTDGSPGRNIAV